MLFLKRGGVCVKNARFCKESTKVISFLHLKCLLSALKNGETACDSIFFTHSFCMLTANRSFRTEKLS